MRYVQPLFGYGRSELGDYVLHVPVQYANPALALVARKAYRGIVHAVCDVAVFYVVHKLVRRHNRAVVFRLGRARAEMGHAYAVFNAYQLV